MARAWRAPFNRRVVQNRLIAASSSSFWDSFCFFAFRRSDNRKSTKPPVFRETNRTAGVGRLLAASTIRCGRPKSWRN